MKRVSEKEEAVLKAVWGLKKAFAKEVREQLPEPKPHINTVATMLKRLVDKGYLTFEDFGSTYRYKPTISQKEYTNKFIKPLLGGFFGNSMKNVVSFFTEEKDITVQELREIIEMVERKEREK
jgi:BlaI family penicillinase repressor